jgi:hypothetical protein
VRCVSDLHTFHFLHLQIDTLQNEWSSQRPPKTKNVLHLSSQKPITPIRYDRASASRQYEDSAADFSHLQIDTLQNEWISQRPPKTKSLVLISPPKPPSPIRYNRASALRQHSVELVPDYALLVDVSLRVPYSL